MCSSPKVPPSIQRPDLRGKFYPDRFFGIGCCRHVCPPSSPGPSSPVAPPDAAPAVAAMEPEVRKTASSAKEGRRPYCVEPSVSDKTRSDHQKEPPRRVVVVKCRF